jgi:hypothetical protein
VFYVSNFFIILFAYRGEDKEEKINSLVIPLKKFISSKPKTKDKDGQKKELCTANIQTNNDGGHIMTRNSLDETAVREILEG